MVKASVCDCGKVSIVHRERCPSCRQKMRVEDVGNQGIVLTYTTLQSPPEGFKPPINLAIVELKNGAKILCEARCEMQIGKEVIIEEVGEKYLCRDK